MLLIALAGTMFVLSNASGLLVVVLICAGRARAYYSCVWSVLAVVSGLVGGFLISRVPAEITTAATLPGVASGTLGLLLWLAGRFHKTKPPEKEEKPWSGPRCVRCQKPLENGATVCGACGWTQPHDRPD